MAARTASLAEIRRQQQQDRTLVSQHPLYSDSEEDEEEEQERMLSEQHGEAQEAGTAAKKTTAADDNDIQNLYRAKHTKKKATITEEDLKSKLLLLTKFSVNTPTSSKDIAGAAQLTNRLLQHVADFCKQVQPQMPVEDAVSKMASLSTKKVVKDYLQHLRQQQRNQYLERLYGLQEADSMIQELEGIHARRLQEEEEYVNALRGLTYSPHNATDATIEASAEPATAAEDSNQSIARDDAALTETSAPGKRPRDDEAPTEQKRRAVLDDESSDEEELEFAAESVKMTKNKDTKMPFVPETAEERDAMDEESAADDRSTQTDVSQEPATQDVPTTQDMLLHQPSPAKSPTALQAPTIVPALTVPTQLGGDSNTSTPEEETNEE